jgi:riboflavin synthase
MFTGLVSDVGTVVKAEGDAKRLRRYVIDMAYAPDSIALGASIACAGICLTAVHVVAGGRGSHVTVETAAETLARTLAGSWQVGTRLNLERSLKVGDELGGHLVTGHVDGIARIVERVDITDGSGPWGATARFEVKTTTELAPYIAEKGSVALNGTSLTVNTSNMNRFSVLLIPHTLGATTFGETRTNDRLHIEVDLMARYAVRFAQAQALSI